MANSKQLTAVDQETRFAERYREWEKKQRSRWKKEEEREWQEYLKELPPAAHEDLVLNRIEWEEEQKAVWEKRREYEWEMKLHREEEDLEKRGVQLPIVDCRGCGACCRHMRSPPFNWRFRYDPEAGQAIMLQRLSHRRLLEKLKQIREPDEWEAADLQRFLELPDAVQRKCIAAMRRALETDDVYPCAWFDEWTRKCLHYESRPEACRDYQPGNLFCLNQRMGAREAGLLE